MRIKGPTCFTNRFCLTCNLSKPNIKDWYKGFTKNCKSCQKLINAEYLRNKLITNLDFKKNRFKANIEYYKQQYANNPVYKQKHKQQCNQYNKQRYHTDEQFRLKSNLRSKQYYYKNKENK